MSNHSLSKDLSPETFNAIAEQITSVDSPVGIDAKKTHVLILHKLEQIETRLARLEEQLAKD